MRRLTEALPAGYKPWGERTAEERCGRVQPIFLNRVQWDAFERAGVDMRPYVISLPVPAGRRALEEASDV